MQPYPRPVPSEPLRGGRPIGRATALVVGELGLDEQALADALTWARRRADELLRALDDPELCAVLEAGGGERLAKGEPSAAVCEEPPGATPEPSRAASDRGSNLRSIPPPPPFASIPRPDEPYSEVGESFEQGWRQQGWRRASG